jgi:translocation and assembly module TamB
MQRRSLVALVAAGVLFTLGLVVVAAIVLVTRTTMGRDKLRGLIQPFATRATHGGSMYIGHLSGNLLTSVTVDSFAIRDKRGELLVSTGRVTLAYNPRDLIDYRLYIRRAEIEHPYVHLIQHENGVWNFKEIFASASNEPNKPTDAKSRNLGDYLVIDSTYTRNASFSLTMPWHPDTALRGAARDSAIRVHLTNPQKAVSKTFDGFGRTYAWTNAHGLISHARLADPDSDRQVGREFRIDSLSVDEFEPTFKFRKVAATVRLLGDSVWFQVPHFEMPASRGTGRGKVWWGSSLPVRYDIAVHGDSVSLDDVNWVYPTLPRTGGGTLDLQIVNDPKNLQVVDFKLVNMDVRTTKSRLTGTMSFGTGAPLLLVRNVDVRADPVDFDLIRTLNGKPFPEDWQGQLVGTVKGRGGPLTHFYVDDAQGSFTDAHVRGAVSRFSAKGELDILNPAVTAFHSLFVDVGVLDLRTVEYLFPNFPPIRGTIAGTATLDSSWLDVRFSDAHLTHQDGPGDPSRVSGSGRITYGEKFMEYDVALDAEPLSLTMLARSFPALPARGLVSGPIRATGSSPDLTLATSLQGANGGFSFDGRLDIDSLGGFGAHGRGEFSSLNLAGLLEKPLPVGTISGHYDVDAAGATAADVQGAASLDLSPTVIDSVHVNASHAHVTLGDGRMTVDSLRVRTNAATLVANGALGLAAGRSDTLHFSIVADSVGGFRSLLPPPDTTLLGAAATQPDSLSGSVAGNGVVTGRIDSLSVSGRLMGTDLFYKAERAQALTATFDLHDMPRAPSGDIAFRVDTLVVAGVALDTVGGRLRFDNARQAHFSVGALSTNGPGASAAGLWTSDSTAQVVEVDSLGLAIGDGRWHLANPARLAMRRDGGMTLDSLLLRNLDTAFIALAAHVPTEGAATADLRASHIPLRDLGTLAQLSDTIAGVVNFTASATGTKANPRILANALLSSIRWKGVDVDSVTSSARYLGSRFNVDMNVVRQGQTAATASASLPLDLTLFSKAWRNDSISGFLRADSTDLAIAQTLFKSSAVKGVRGRLDANVRVGGTPRAVLLDGTASIKGGAVTVNSLNVAMTDITGNFFGGKNAAGQDSINVNVSAATTGDKNGRLALAGWVKNLARANAQPSFAFALGANAFHAINKRSLADLYLTTLNPSDSIRLRGSIAAPTLTGALFVDHGSVFLPDPDLARKQAVDILPDSLGVSSVAGGSAMVQTLMANLAIQNVTVTLGNDVRLRSKEANVQLAGNLQLVTNTDRSTRTLASNGELVPRLELQGVLRTVGGTYTLNLGLVQREFQVLADGTVTFNGPPENPALDIRALYNVKQARDRDLGVIVKIQGPVLPYPPISFESTADYAISSSDLLSYLLTGRPGFDFSTNQPEVLASFLAPTVSAFTADKLRQSFGSFVDLQFQLGAGGQDVNGNFSARQYLSGATIGAGKQLTNNLYLNVNTGGFCPTADANGGAKFNPLSGLGAKLEYRFKPELSMQFAYDPPTISRTCNLNQNISGFVQTPSQIAFSLSHAWRF